METILIKYLNFFVCLFFSLFFIVCLFNYKTKYVRGVTLMEKTHLLAILTIFYTYTKVIAFTSIQIDSIS